MANHPKYDLRRSTNNQFYWNLTASNGQVILTSETYVSKQGALNGIGSCRRNSPTDSRYRRLMSSNNQYYFNLRAENNEVIGTSEMYTTEQARETGIASVKRNGPIAETEDNT